ncbi:MAG: tryptophan synthase subunit alpha [Rickettsiales bacterium]|nr:tryptophan synthase subunit alpha [Rickettsiales bacterium]
MRIDNKFSELKKQGKKAFICYLMASDPSENFTAEILPKIVDAGCDIIELGMPFSDPMAEGQIIQDATKRALKNNCDINKVFEIVSNFRKTNNHTPIILMGYYNPVLKYGVQKFLENSKYSGVDGFIIVDLPFEEENEFTKFSKALDLPLIRLTTPTTDENRAEKILKTASGFVYHISVSGVTGQKEAIADSVASGISKIKKYTNLPVCAGFGIKTASQAKEVAKNADGIVIGSALIKMIEENLENPKLAEEKIINFVKAIREVL